MSYKFQKMTSEIWDGISENIPDSLRKSAIAQGWPEVVLLEGLVVSESSRNWLCRSPNMMRDRHARWFMFHLNEKSYCFRIIGIADPVLEFFEYQPLVEDYDEFKTEFLKAFAIYSLHELGGRGFPASNFPEIAGGAK